MESSTSHVERELSHPERSHSEHLATEREKDEIYFVLSNYRRRFVIDYMTRSDTPVSLRTLAEALAAWENDIEPKQTSSVERKRAYVSLRQTHLPKLHDVGIVRFDAGRGTVDAGPKFTSVKQYVAGAAEGESVEWRRLAGFATVVGVVLGLGLLGVLLL